MYSFSTSVSPTLSNLRRSYIYVQKYIYFFSSVIFMCKNSLISVFLSFPSHQTWMLHMQTNPTTIPFLLTVIWSYLTLKCYIRLRVNIYPLFNLFVRDLFLLSLDATYVNKKNRPLWPS